MRNDLKQISLIVFLLIFFFNINAQFNENIFRKQLADKYIHKAYNFFPKGELDSGFHYTKKAFNISNKLKNDSLITDCNYLIGRYYFEISNYDSSLYYNEKAMKSYLKYGNIKFACKTMIRIAEIYTTIGEFTKALPYLYKTQKLTVQTNDTNLYINSCIGLYEIHMDLEQNNQAFQILQYAENYIKKSNHYLLKHSLSSLFSSYYVSIKLNADSAIFFSKKSLEYANLTNKESSVYEAYCSLGDSYLLKGDFLLSEKYYKTALTYFEKKHQTNTVNTIKKSLGELYFKIKRYKESNDCFKQALSFYVENEFDKDIYDTYWWLAKNAEALGDFKNALKYYKIYSEGYDDLVTNENIERLNKIKKDNEIKEKEDALILNQERHKIKQSELFKIKQSQIIILFISIIFILIIVFLYFYYNYRLKKEKNEKNILLRLKDSEIITLQSQINPHFIFNSLNTILSYIKKSNNEVAIKYLSKFSKIVRQAFENSRNKSILLADEIKFIGLYLELEQLRENNTLGFKYEIVIDENLDIYITDIPFMIIQPFLENAIKHGIQNKEKECQENNELFYGEIKLNIYKVSETTLICEIKDNGIGIVKAKQIANSAMLKHNSLGLVIIKERLNLLTNNNCQIIYSNIVNPKTGAVEGTKVSIEIPILN